MHRISNKYLVLFAVIALISLTAGIATAAVVTNSITYQGKLTNAAGSPLTGTYSVTFKLYDASTGGTTLSTDTHSVTATNGLFTTTIAVNSAVINGRSLWLGIKVGSDAEMTPRQEIRPVPYALSLRPDAWITGTDVSSALNLQNTGGGKALNVSTNAFGSKGIYVVTDGQQSAAVYAIANGIQSNAVVGETSADGPAAVAGLTTGKGSYGLYGKTTGGPGSMGVYTITSGPSSAGVYTITTGDNSNGVHASVSGKNSNGVDVVTAGSGSKGVNVFTGGAGSPGAEVVTAATNSNGINISTSGSGSTGIYVVANGQQTPAIHAIANGYKSNAVVGETSADYSPVVHGMTTGNASHVIDATTTGSASHGLLAIAEGSGSYGVWAGTSGKYGHGVFAHSSGSESYGVLAVSDQDSALFADTLRPDHAYGVETNDKMYAMSFDTTHIDVAEYFPVWGDPEPGTVLVIGADKTLEKSSVAYDTRVAGIVSSAPGMSLGIRKEGNPNEAAVAVAGRVPCKVDTTHAPIHAGDLLTTSDTPGYAMKADPVEIGGIMIYRPGTIIGKAMESFESGTGTIEVLVTLQ
jgi:hypothetical protein